MGVEEGKTFQRAEKRDLINDISDNQTRKKNYHNIDLFDRISLGIESIRVGVASGVLAFIPPAHPHQSIIRNQHQNWQNFRHDFEMCINGKNDRFSLD